MGPDMQQKKVPNAMGQYSCIWYHVSSGKWQDQDWGEVSEALNTDIKFQEAPKKKPETKTKKTGNNQDK